MSLRVLMVTSEWPTVENPSGVPFLVNQVESLRQLGISVDVFSFRGNGQPRQYYDAWRRLSREKQIENYDLVHAQFGQSGLIVPKSLSCPVVVTFHGSDLNGYYNSKGNLKLGGWILRKVSQFVALRADAIILVSRTLARYLPGDRPYHVIPCGVDLSVFRPMKKRDARRQLDLSENGQIVLFTGGVRNPIKRVGLARESVELLGKQGMDVRLLIANGVQPDRMPLYLNASDALLLTSIREGSPTIVKEALACNLPIVSVDVGDVRERLKELDACAVCSEDTPQAIAGALQRVLSYQGPLELRHAVKNLGLDSTAARIVEVYSAVIGKYQ